MYWSMQMCSAIPRGKVSTYGAMAAALQSSARAAGQVRRCALHDSQARPQHHAQALHRRQVAACVLCGAHYVSLSYCKSRPLSFCCLLMRALHRNSIRRRGAMTAACRR